MTDEVWVPITYEKLPEFCYNCGKMGHVLKVCEDYEEDQNEELEFGLWLKETGPSRQKQKSWREDLRNQPQRGRGREKGKGISV